MNNSFSSIVDASSSVLLLLPTKPFFDQVAAGLSLSLSMRDKKEIIVSCPTPMVVEFNHLVGVNKVTQELGSKNLVVRFVDYKANDIERVSYDIENEEFRLTVIPKSNAQTPKKDQVVLSHSGVSADTVILVGGLNDSHFPHALTKDLESAKLIHIGNRPLNLSSKTIISFARPASSVSEIVAALIKEEGLTIDSDVATNLVMGIEEGSSHFTSSDVTAETFEHFAYLLRAGGKRFAKDKVVAKQFPQGAVPETRQVQITEEDVNVAEIEKKEIPQGGNPPADWLTQPKIYRGTSIS